MKAKKKILIFIDWFLPGYKAGGPIRSCANMIDHLAEDFEFYVVTRDTDYTSTTPYEGITPNTWVKRGAHLQVYYLSKDQVNGKAIKSLIDTTEFDEVYLNGVYSYYFTILPLRYLNKKKQRVIVAARGMLSDHALQVKSLKKKLFLSMAKLTGLFSNVLFHATAEQEAREIRKNFNNTAKIVVAPNLPKKMEVVPVSKEKEAGNLNLISMGRIAPEKNTLYALQCLASLQGKVQLDLYGAVYSEEYWKDCERMIKNLPENITVNVQGSVGEEIINDALNRAHVLFMPSTGENFGHAILEALSAGLPVLISDQTPWRNLEAKRAGWDLDLKDQESFVQRLQECVNTDQSAYDQQAKAAHELAKAFITQTENVELNKKLFLG